MTIENNMVVSVNYQLKEAKENGALIEQTSKEKPFTFLFGAGSLLPEFEANLKGKKVGDTFDFSIASANAYGETDPQAVGELPIQMLVEGGLKKEELQLGMILPLQDQGGHVHQAKVTDITDEMVKVDLNHPMAGIDLHFTGEVLEVRAASETEVAHGHVHGPGGHDH